MQAINLKYYPDKTHKNSVTLGYTVPRASFPPEPDPAMRSLYEQQVQANMQNIMQTMRRSIEERAQQSKFFHDLNMKIIGNINGSTYGCRVCGASNCYIHR